MMEKFDYSQEEINELLGDLKLDLDISRYMVDLIQEDTPLKQWHQGRVSYLNGLLGNVCNQQSEKL